MSSNGKFRLDRRTFDDWTAEEKPWCAGLLWIYMISRAQYKKTPITYLGHSFFLDRGQFVTSQNHLCDIAGWSRERLRLFLSKCKKDGKIVTTGNWNGTVITIVSYDKWQSPVSVQKQMIAKQPTKQPTSTQLQSSVTPHVQPTKQPTQPTKQPTSTQLQSSVTPHVQPTKQPTEYLRLLVSKEDKEKDFSFHPTEQPAEKQNQEPKQTPKHASIDDLWQQQHVRPEPEPGQPGPEPEPVVRLVRSYIPKANHETLGQLHKRLIAAAGSCKGCRFNGGYEEGGHCTAQAIWDKDNWRAIFAGIPASCLKTMMSPPGTGGKT